MNIAECLDCGLSSDSTFFDLTEAVIEDPLPPFQVREGSFFTCPNCESIDVDVYSPRGWQIEMAIRAEEQA